jgi:hypothetical protein
VSDVEFVDPERPDESADEPKMAQPPAEATEAPQAPQAREATAAAGAPPANEPGVRPYDPDRTRFGAAGVLWLGAAVLAVIAAYQQIYAVGFGTGGSRFRYTLDAWGAYGGAGAVEAHRNGPAYARVLIVCALLFAVLGVSALGRAFGLRAKRYDGVAAAAGIGVAGVLAGLLAALYLEVTSTLDGIRASLQADVASGDPVRGDIVTTVGHSAYVALAALACGILAVVASVMRRRSAD